MGIHKWNSNKISCYLKIAELKFCPNLMLAIDNIFLCDNIKLGYYKCVGRTILQGWDSITNIASSEISKIFMCQEILWLKFKTNFNWFINEMATRLCFIRKCLKLKFCQGLRSLRINFCMLVYVYMKAVQKCVRMKILQGMLFHKHCEYFIY